ncbi:MAG TPA: GNAT family N-acetyltransferase [Planctomycetota bacterium]
MTTVRIETQAPGEESCRDELERVLGAQPGREPGWGSRVLAAAALREDPFAAFLRAVETGPDGESLAGGALLLGLAGPGEAQARPWFAALWVRSDLRGRGLGRKLARKVEDLARAGGGEELVLEVGPEDDTALFTAERWGFFRERLWMSRSL